MTCSKPWPARVLATVCLSSLAACSTSPTALEQAFGQATREARWLQTADPTAPEPAWHDPRTDGESARRVVQRYYRSLDTPAAPPGVLGSVAGQNPARTGGR